MIAVRIPMIVVDPSPAADTTRGRVDEHLVVLLDFDFDHVGLRGLDHLGSERDDANARKGGRRS